MRAYRRPLRGLASAILDLEDGLFDRLHSIETMQWVWQPHIQSRFQDSAPHATRYEPTRLRTIRRLVMECFRTGARPAAFIDLGSGKGRVCFYAATTRRFRKVIGVEFSQELTDVAHTNLIRFGAAPIELVCEDAGRFRIPELDSLVFLGNPFGPAILARFLELNAQTFRHTQSFIAYYNDYHRDVILQHGFEVLFREQRRKISLYRAPPANAATSVRLAPA
jgi:predicted RNA methylase